MRSVFAFKRRAAFEAGCSYLITIKSGKPELRSGLLANAGQEKAGHEDAGPT